MRSQAVAVEAEDVLNNVTSFKLLGVSHEVLLLMLVNRLHGSLEKASGESGHVQHSAIDEELFDYVLIAKDFAQPKRETNVVLECLANDPDKGGNLSAYACSECYCKRKSEDILQNLELILQDLHSHLVGALKIGCTGTCIVLVLLEVEATSEDLKTLFQELAVEDEPGQPELSILLQNSLMNCRCDLDLAGNCERNPALVEEVLGGTLVARRRLVLLQNDAVVVCELIEPLLVNEAVALVDEDVSVLRLVATLVHNYALHVRIV